MIVNLAEPICDTFQGEHPLLGSPVKLVRFQGCNLADTCPLDCDTKYSWDLKEKLVFDINHIKPQNKYQNLMITGGEPFVQADSLFELIKHWINNFESDIIIETNGTLITDQNLRKIYSLSDNRVFVSISPKNNESFTNVFDLQIPVKSFCKHISFKVVVRKDWPSASWVKHLKQAILKNHPIYLMPEGITLEQIIQNLEYVKLLGEQIEGNYRLSPRCHIFLGIK